MAYTTTYRGYKTQIMYATETAYGTGGTVSAAIEGKVQSLTINQNNNFNGTLGLGEGRNETFIGFGNYEVSWSMEYEISGWEFLQFGIGIKGGSGTAGTPFYLEEKDEVNYSTGLKSFKMEIGKVGVTNETTVLSGGIINNIGLSLNIGQTMTCSLDGFGKKPTYATAITTYVPSTTKPWIFSQGVFKWGATGAEATIARVTSATINIAFNYDPEVGRELGSRFVEAAEPGLRKYNFVVTVKSTDDVRAKLIQDFLGATSITSPSEGIADAEPTFKDLILNLSEGSTSAKRNAQIKLQDCTIDDISEPIEIGTNIIEYTINGRAKKGTTDTTNRPIKWWTV
jgi:hypothetical protein